MEISSRWLSLIMVYIVIGGLVASTALTIFPIPAFYLIMQGKQLDSMKHWGREK